MGSLPGRFRERLRGLIRTLFCLTEPVGRRTYIVVGFVLMAIKLTVDVFVFWFNTGHVGFPPHAFDLGELLRDPGAGPPWYAIAVVVWSLPFVWIGVAMSTRRAADAGLSRFLGLLFFVPFVSYLLILLLALLPTAVALPALPSTASTASLTVAHPVERPPRRPVGLLSSAPLTVTVLFSAVVACGMVLLSAFVLRSYGAALFVGTPFVLGEIFGFGLNRAAPRSLGATLGLLTMFLLGVSVLLVVMMLEGAICIVMAMPIAWALAAVGAGIGRAIAITPPTGALRNGSHTFVLVLALPGLGAAEAGTDKTPRVHEVVSIIEIDAPPEAVWPNVVGFSELPPPTELLFRAGIAYPQRARIDGEGVGAVRRCEFSTGPFVEPITAWEAPHRLAFDVTEHPLPMRELTPYADIHPPHLDGYFRSVRGEFRLTPLPHGRTRLEGSTWYVLEIHPVPYWRVFAEYLLHTIHDRVLTHVATLSER